MKRLYSRIRSIVPSGLHGHLSYLLYLAGVKPSVNKRVKSHFAKGIIVLSADFEMAWAFRYSKKQGRVAVEKGLLERDNVPKILSLFEKYKIPVTWATVGHLFLESCRKGEEGSAHAEMPRPGYFENRNWLFSKGDWYDNDPCADYHASPAWYAPDLIKEIIQSPVNHEIGCHTFSHIDCTDENCPPELFKAELKECIKEAAKLGRTLKSMVFPGGTHGNYSSLKEMGFASYRKQMKYHIDLPVIDKHGLVQIPCSQILEKPKYNWSAKTCIWMMKSFINKAARHKLVGHLWFHPSMNTWYLENVLPQVLSYIRKMEDEGQIEVLTMEQLAENSIRLQTRHQ